MQESRLFATSTGEDMNDPKEIERLCACVQQSGHYAVIDRIPGIGYFVSTNYGTISSQSELEEWMKKVTFRHPHKECLI